MNTIIARMCRIFSLCLIMLLSQSCLAQFQGKLFTTPEERVYLDALRANFLRESREQGFDITETGPPPLPEADEQANETAAPVEYTLGGILTRSDGTRTVWLNNQPIAESNLPANMRLVADGPQVALRIGTGANFFLIKPGQTVNMSTGEILEAYQRLPATGSTNTSAPPTSIETEAPAAQSPVDGNPEGAPESAAPEAPAEAGTRETP
jgi:hypothetical protein